MKNKITFLAVLLTTIGQAQDPAIQWQQTIGGSASDLVNSMELTADGGCIIGGYSASGLTGDKTENSNGGLDIWIVKLNGAGGIQWQNSIGGSGDDYLNVIKPTTDGGYIVIAGSNSNISGDKTENSRGGLDYWILKLDSVGDIVWQRTYGGANPDFDTYGQQTADGGYIIGGYSDSGATGDKTEASNGQRDYWILKLDTAGAIVWQNGIGGNLIDRVQAIQQTADGGYIVGGFSTSGISGDKTEGSQGGNDYWIVKISALGVVQWDNTIGGSGADSLRDLIQTTDGGYLTAGYSQSGISGDKTENSNGDYDYWLVKLTPTGTISWQQTLGGVGTEFLRDIKQLADSTYLVAGYSNSGISGDKTEVSNGGYDYWLLRLDANGAIIAQNSIGGGADESGPYILPTADGGYMLACSSDSNTSGDKTSDSKGAEDYWILKVSADILGVASNESALTFSAGPNPTQGILTIDLGKAYASASVTVTTVLGQTVQLEYFEKTQILEFRLDGMTGMYLVTVKAEGREAVFKILRN